MIKIAPSILSADFAALGSAVETLSLWGADYVHVDVMDGHFVPNLTFGPHMVRALRAHTALPLDVHLMMDEPARWIDAFIEAGADIVTFHAEAEPHIHRLLTQIRGAGRQAGVVLNPATPLSAVEWVLEECDIVLLMSVNPGYGGQSFIPNTTQRIRALHQMKQQRGLTFDIEVDGGVNANNAKLCREAGATVLVAGNSVFRAQDPKAMIEALRG